MRRKHLAIAAVMILAGFTGCSQITPLQSIVNEGYIAKPDNYVVLDEVEGHATAARLLGLIPMGFDAGYLAAYQDALENSQHPDANGLIEVFSDTKVTHIPFSFLPLYTSWTTIVYGKAIRDVGASRVPSTEATK